MNKKHSLICVSLICSASTTVNADTQAYVDLLFDWAETQFPEVLPAPAAIKDKIIKKLDVASEALSLGAADAAQLSIIAKKVSAGDPVTAADLSPALIAINDKNESFIFRGYSNNFFLGTGTKPLTPNFSEVCTLNLNEANAVPVCTYGTIPEVMVNVPVATTGGTAGCVTVPRITNGTKVTYSIDSKATADLAVDQIQNAVYKEVSATKIMVDINDQSFGASPSTQAMTQTLGVIEKDGWRSLASSTLAFNDPSVAGTFTAVTNETPKLLGPANSYCTDHTWTTNVVKQITTGEAVVTENGQTTKNPINATSIDELVQKGKVMSTAESLTIGDKTYDTVKVSITNVLSDFKTLIWYDKVSGVDVKEVLMDARNNDAVITETMVTLIEAP